MTVRPVHPLGRVVVVVVVLAGGEKREREREKERFFFLRSFSPIAFCSRPSTFLLIEDDDDDDDDDEEMRVGAIVRASAPAAATMSSKHHHHHPRRRETAARTTTTPKTRPPFLSTRLRASFEKIDISSVSSSSDDVTKNDDDDDDESDKELPNDLFDAVNTAASSTSRAISAGQLGIIVELLIPELWDPISGNVMANPGDQLKQWEISRQFAQKLLEERSDECEVTVVFPDAGCAALLKNRWGDNLKFKIASANDRMLVPDDYEGILLFAAADPISLDVVVKSTKKANELQNPVILLNPRLASGDAGIGLTVRRWRDQFLGVMCVAYSLRPLPWCNGTVFKKFPGPWKLYIEKENVPGRFELVHESNSRPAGDELDDLVSEAYRGRDVGEDGEMREKSAVEKLAGFAASMARFAKSLSN